MALGVSLVATGLALGVTLLARKRGGVWAFAIPGALIAFGLAAAGTGAASEYGSHVDRTEQAVREQLNQLDPFARVKILKDLASEQVPSFMRKAEEVPE